MPFLLLFLVSFSPAPREFEANMKLVRKDLESIFKVEELALEAVGVPDSLYNNLLMDYGFIYNLKDTSGSFGYVYVGRVFSCRAGGCTEDGEEQFTSLDEDFEYFDYYIVLGTDLNVLKVKVYNYQATYGQQICSSGWLKQFVGYRGQEKLDYGKDIDAISGATISANAITYGVQETVRYIKLLEPVLYPDTHHASAGVIK